MATTKNVIVTILSLILVVTIFELYFRLYAPQIMQHDEMFCYDSSLGWRFVPNKKGSIYYSNEVRNYVTTNHHGFRDSPFSKTDKQLRKIVVLGDSFVSNISVNDKDVFTEVMEQLLDNTTVMNFGVNGYSTVQEYILLNKVLQEFIPDLIILVIYVRNDFIENLGFIWMDIHRPKAILNEDNLDVEISPVPKYHRKAISESALIKTIKNSHFFYFVKRRLQYLIYKYATPKESKLAPSKFTPQELYLCYKPASKKADKMCRVMEAVLLKFAKLCEAKNLKLLFVIAPSIVQVDKARWVEMLDEYDENAADYDYSKPNKKLVKFAKENGFQVLDLLPVLEAETLNRKRLYNRTEQHWTKEGNYTVAHEIVNYIKSQEDLHTLF